MKADPLQEVEDARTSLREAEDRVHTAEENARQAARDAEVPVAAVEKSPPSSGTSRTPSCSGPGPMPNYRGLGRALLDEVTHYARAHQLDTLTVWPSERSAPLYRRCGFRHYNGHRPHQARGQLPPLLQEHPTSMVAPAAHRVLRTRILGGVINEYRYAA